ncbi:MbnP family copper-binding protein [Rheinheimera riviphila]|nr:MbnP family copper-binding protein [Rheinheimera riviphila]
MLLSACQPKSNSTLLVQLLWQGQPIDCNSKLLLGGQPWQLQQLQFYLSNFSQQQQPLLLQPNDYQSTELALLGSDCQSPGQWQLQFAAPLLHAPLEFELGVPFLLNHQNPLTAGVPLQQMDMHWAWQSGYKFFRLDLNGPQHDWSLHLGSSGCSSASVMRAPTTPCTAPNRVQVQLPYQDQSTLTLDLAALFGDFIPAADNSCMADPASLSCQQLLPALGIGIGGSSTVWALQP